MVYERRKIQLVYKWAKQVEIVVHSPSDSFIMKRKGFPIHQIDCKRPSLEEEEGCETLWISLEQSAFKVRSF